MALSDPALRDLLPQLEQAPTSFGCIQQQLDFIERSQPFLQRGFPQFSQGASYQTPHMKLADLALQTQLFSYVAEARQVVAHDHTHCW